MKSNQQWKPNTSASDCADTTISLICSWGLLLSAIFVIWTQQMVQVISAFNPALSSQARLQISKCSEDSWWKPWRRSWKTHFASRATQTSSTPCCLFGSSPRYAVKRVENVVVHRELIALWLKRWRVRITLPWPHPFLTYQNCDLNLFLATRDNSLFAQSFHRGPGAAQQKVRRSADVFITEYSY